MSNIDVKEILKILQFDKEQTDIELATCATIQADLKNQIKTKLREADEVKRIHD